MKDSLSALLFLIALTLVPAKITVGLLWSALHFTETGLLVSAGEVTVQPHREAVGDNRELAVVACSYVTSSGFVEEIVEHKDYGYKGQRDCPWYIDLTA